ncbi:MAG TPA: prepilin peptidase [Steroidobacteraceae bacterium]
MEAIGFLHGIRVDFIGGEAYKFSIEAATVAVLCYIGITDFRFFKIHNGSVLLLLAFYVLYAVGARSRYEILSDVLLGCTLFAVLLWLYRKGTVGGGDVKLVPVVCLWIGVHCAILFSVFLLLFVVLHLAAAKAGCAPTEIINGRANIPYAPSLAAALIGVIVTGCL